MLPVDSDERKRTCVGPLVLVADDSDDGRALMTFCLTKAGFQVIEARDGDEAVRLTREQRPHLVLLDLWMPNRDGWSAAETLHADSRTQGIPLLVVSGDLVQQSRQRAIAVGCVGFVEKPFNPAHLLDEVHRALALAPSRVAFA